MPARLAMNRHSASVSLLVVYMVDHKVKKKKNTRRSHILPVPPRPRPPLALVAVHSERGHDHVWHDASVHSAWYLMRGLGKENAEEIEY